MRHVILIGMLLTPPLACAQSAQLIRLGHLPGPYPASSAYDVSANGQFVSGKSRSHVGFWGEAYRWDPQNGMVGLGLLPGHNQSSGGAISPDGSWLAGHSVMSPEHIEAFAWSPGTGLIGLGDLPGGEFDSIARGVSHNGRVIVGTGSTHAAGWNADTIEAFRWTAESGMVGLGTISSGDNKPSSSARDVSANGRVIVGYSTSALGTEAFRWTPESGMVGLGAIDPEYFISEATAVSNNGLWTVGTSQTPINGGSSHATQGVLWTPEGDIVQLGWPVEALHKNTWVRDVTNDGSMVIGNVTGVREGNAFLWTPDDGMRLLHQVLLEDYGLDTLAMGWRLNNVSGISPDGLTIVGTGRNPEGFGEPFVIRLPTPGSLAPLLAAGLLATTRRR